MVVISFIVGDLRVICYSDFIENSIKTGVKNTRHCKSKKKKWEQGKEKKKRTNTHYYFESFNLLNSEKSTGVSAVNFLER